MGHKQNGGSREELLHEVEHAFGRRVVESARHFVHEENVGLETHSPQKNDALLLAPRKRVRPVGIAIELVGKVVEAR